MKKQNSILDMANKKRHHFVWQHYLRAWENDGLVCCHREGIVTKRNTINIATEKYFYRAEKLNQVEIDFIDRLAISKSPPQLQNIYRDSLKTHNKYFEFNEVVGLKALDEKTFTENRTWLENNIYEEQHSLTEANAIKYLDSLLNKEVNFYKDNDEKMDFLLFLSTQYLRTKKIKNSVLESAGILVKDKIGIDLEKIWNPLSSIFAMNIAYNMFLEEYRIIIFDNDTPILFVTGDQPVINICAANVPKGQVVKELKLYFPISPKISVLLTKDLEEEKNVNPVEENTVLFYNNQIFKNCYKEVYGTTEECFRHLNSGAL